MRLEKLIKFVLFGILIFVTSALLINFWFIPRSKEALDENQAIINSIKTQIYGMELPIMTMENNQIKYSLCTDHLVVSELLNEYETSVESLRSILLILEDDIIALGKILDSLNIKMLSQQDLLYEEMMQIIDQTTMEIKTIQSKIALSEIDTIQMDVVKKSRSIIHNNISELVNLESQKRVSVIEDFAFVVNLMFIILILMLILFSIGSIKYVVFNQKFLLHGLNQMEQKQFDFSKLPKIHPFFREETEIYNSIRNILEDEEFTSDVKDYIVNAYHINDLIERLYEILSARFRIDRVGVAFVDYSNQKFIAEFGVANYENIRLGPGFEVGFNDTTLTSILRNKQSIIMDDLDEVYKTRPKSKSLKLIMSEGIKSNLMLPLIMGDIVFGVVFFSSSEKAFFTERHKKAAEKLLKEISSHFNSAYFTKIILSKITNSFSELVDKKDNETGDHISRMVAYSVVIAEGLLNIENPEYKVNRRFVLEIERNASSHDIGKVAIPDEILKKPGKLTDEEWTIMKTHTDVGGDIFKSFREGLEFFETDFYEYSEEIARYHHERWDGSGYPEGLTGPNIPLSARIVAIGDVFDALTSKRHYKDGFSFEKSVEIIKESAGSHFDPVLVEVFMSNISSIHRIYNKYGGTHDF